VLQEKLVELLFFFSRRLSQQLAEEGGHCGGRGVSLVGRTSFGRSAKTFIARAKARMILSEDVLSCTVPPLRVESSL
jgi:hypothetical protein